MLAALYGGCVIAVFPECAAATLAVVELLAGSTGNELHAASDLLTTAITHDQMNVVARDVVVEPAQAEALAGAVAPVFPRGGSRSSRMSFRFGKKTHEGYAAFEVAVVFSRWNTRCREA
jgi:hypothetical protein